ncbi:MAG: hypothetical protein K6A82_03640 [Prevotella sp.]|nr:hypothetical protein [Prevotella sp.]
MILTDKMLSLALDVREAQPWKLIDDSCLFAIRLSSGETGYICVMGNGGEHFAIGLYIGQQGFSDYLTSLKLEGESQTEMMEKAMSFDYIMCDFENASEIEPETKKRIKAYTDTNGRKIRRPKGWPDFTRHSPYKALFPITDEKDAQAITEALQAVLALSGKLHETPAETLGFDPKRRYPTTQGGKTVPLLTPANDGCFEFGTTVLPPMIQNKHEMIPFTNDILAHTLSTQPKGGAIACKFFHLPQPVNNGQEEVPYLMPLILLLNEANGMVFPIMPTEDNPGNLNYLLTNLAQTFTEQKKAPTEIVVTEQQTQALLKDFCRRCGIRLTLTAPISELEEATEMFYMQMTMFG